jgi:hypothetical protein
MTIAWSFRYYAELLPEEIFDRIHEAQVRQYYRPTAVEELVIRNSQNNEILKKVNSPYAMRIHRAGLRKLLLNGIKVQVYFTT